MGNYHRRELGIDQTLVQYANPFIITQYVSESQTDVEITLNAAPNCTGIPGRTRAETAVKCLPSRRVRQIVRPAARFLLLIKQFTSAMARGLASAVE